MPLTPEDLRQIADVVTALIKPMFANTNRLIDDLTVHADERFDELEARLDAIDARLRTHAADIQAGRRLESRHATFRDDISQNVADIHALIAKHSKRLDKLERSKEPNAE